MNWTDEDVRYEKRDSFLNGLLVGLAFMTVLLWLLTVFT